MPDQLAPVEPEAYSPLSRSLLALAVGGFVIVILAFFFLQWPVPRIGDVPGAMTTQIHLKRVELRFSGGDASNIPGAILDVLAYVAIGAGIALTVWAVRARQRMPLIGLMLVGLFGLAYSGGMALYVGPMISLCGFILVFFVGLLLLITYPDDETLSKEPPSEVVAEAARTEGFIPWRSDDDASDSRLASAEAQDRVPEVAPDGAEKPDAVDPEAEHTAQKTETIDTDFDGTPGV